MKITEHLRGCPMRETTCTCERENVLADAIHLRDQQMREAVQALQFIAERKDVFASDLQGRARKALATMGIV
jgi:hypothetical protein